jgi:hypothetical protein
LKRVSFLGATAWLALTGSHAANARGASTILCVACNVDELEDESEDTLAGLLRDRGVNVVDPSAIDARYHREARLVAERLGDTVTVDYSDLAWVTAKYHAQRLLTVDVRLTSSTLPYGEFTVFNVRARASYRAFDTTDKTIVGGGTSLGTGKSEDERTAQESALSDAMKAVARDYSRRASD